RSRSRRRSEKARYLLFSAGGFLLEGIDHRQWPSASEEIQRILAGPDYQRSRKTQPDCQPSHQNGSGAGGLLEVRSAYRRLHEGLDSFRRKGSGITRSFPSIEVAPAQLNWSVSLATDAAGK